MKAYFVLCIDYTHSMKYDGKSTSKREAGSRHSKSSLSSDSVQQQQQQYTLKVTKTSDPPSLIPGQLLLNLPANNLSQSSLGRL